METTDAWWKIILMMIGAGYLGLLVVIFIMWLHDKLNDLIENIRYTYQVKHRFDGTPTSKCWCRDCYNWNPKTSCCCNNQMYTRDNNFCGDASPLDLEQAKLRQEYYPELYS